MTKLRAWFASPLTAVLAGVLCVITPVNAFAFGANHQRVIICGWGGLGNVGYGTSTASFVPAFNFGGTTTPFVVNGGATSGPNLASLSGLSSFSSVNPSVVWYPTSSVSFATPTTTSSGADLAAWQEYQSFQSFRNGGGGAGRSGADLASVNSNFQSASVIASTPGHDSVAASVGIASADLATVGSYLSQFNAKDILPKAMNLMKIFSQFIPGFNANAFMNFVGGLLNGGDNTNQNGGGTFRNTTDVGSLRSDIQALRGEIKTLTGAINEIRKTAATIEIKPEDIQPGDEVVSKAADGKTIKVLRGYKPVKTAKDEDSSTPAPKSPKPEPKHNTTPVPPDPGTTH